VSQHPHAAAGIAAPSDVAAGIAAPSDLAPGIAAPSDVAAGIAAPSVAAPSGVWCCSVTVPRMRVARASARQGSIRAP
jgi:hypothetical protein